MAFTRDYTISLLCWGEGCGLRQAQCMSCSWVIQLQNGCKTSPARGDSYIGEQCAISLPLSPDDFEY